MFFRIVIPPTLQLLCVLLLIISLVSPVPFHGSSIALIFVSPAPAGHGTDAASSQAASTFMPDPAPGMPLSTTSPPAPPPPPPSTGAVAPPTAAPTSPAAPTSSAHSLAWTPEGPSAMYTDVHGSLLGLPPQTASSTTARPSFTNPGPLRRALLLPRDDSPQIMGNLPDSQVQYAVGLLGACFQDAQKHHHCSGSSLTPSINHTQLLSAPGVDVDSTSLPAGWSAQAVLYLLALLVIIVTSSAQARRVHYLALSKDHLDVAAAALGRYRRACMIAMYVQDGASSVLLLCMIALRIQVGRVLDSFNAANAQRPLRVPAVTPMPNSVPLVLQAATGTEFSAVCVSAALLFVLSWIERRRLRAETQHGSPNTAHDLESHPMQEKHEALSVWQRLWRAPLHTAEKPSIRSMTISTPIPIPPPHGAAPSPTTPDVESPGKASTLPGTPMREDDPWPHGVRRLVVAPAAAQ